MMRRGVATALGCMAALSFARSTEAAPAARLVYARGPGAEDCPDETVLRKAVAARVGYDPFFPWAPLTVSVEVSADRGHLRGRIVLIEAGGLEKGAQTIDDTSRARGGAASCEDLLGSIALAVSVALDADKAAVAPAPEEPPVAPPETAPSTPVPAEKKPDATPPPTVPPVVREPTRREAPARARGAKVSLWIAAGPRVSFGAWRVAALAPDLLVEVRSGHFGIGLEGRYDVLATSIAVGPDENASVDRPTASLVPCAHYGWFSPCAVATVGETRAHGDNVQNGTTASTPYAAFGGRLGVDWTLVPRFHLLFAGDVVGIATPTHVAVGQNAATSGPVEASATIAALVPIF